MKFIPLICLVCLCASGVARAGSPGWDSIGIQRQVEKLLVQQNYASLDALAESVKHDGCDIEQEFPELYCFYLALELPANATDAQWQYRLATLRAWCAASPYSLTARIALAQWYAFYAWHFDPSVHLPGNRNITVERLSQAQQLLASVPSGKIDDPHFYYLWLVITDGEAWPESQTYAYFKKGIAISRDYYPLYHQAAFNLLTNNVGFPGDREAFMKTAAAGFQSPASDILYAHLTLHAGEAGENFHTLDDLNYERAKAGFLASSARHPSVAKREKSALCYLAAKIKDAPTVKEMFSELGDNVDTGCLGGRERLADIRRNFGIRGPMDTVFDLERAGQLDGAEALLRLGTFSPAASYPLTRFYLREGRDAELQSSTALFYNLTVPQMEALDTTIASPDNLATAAMFLAMLGQWDKALSNARAFDIARPWNFIGKNTLFLYAVERGDAKMAEIMRQEIISMETDRHAYLAAQAILKGNSTWNQIKAGIMDDKYLAEAAAAIFLYYTAHNQPDAARKVLDDTLPLLSDKSDTANFLRSIAFGSLSRSLKPAALLQ